MEKQRYCLESLRKVSHILCLRAVVELQQLMWEASKYASVCDLKELLENGLDGIAGLRARKGVLGQLIAKAAAEVEQIYLLLERVM